MAGAKSCISQCRGGKQEQERGANEVKQSLAKARSTRREHNASSGRWVVSPWEATFWSRS